MIRPIRAINIRIHNQVGIVVHLLPESGCLEARKTQRAGATMRDIDWSVLKRTSQRNAAEGLPVGGLRPFRLAAVGFRRQPEPAEDRQHHEQQQRHRQKHSGPMNEAELVHR